MGSSLIVITDYKVLQIMEYERPHSPHFKRKAFLTCNGNVMMVIGLGYIILFTIIPV